MTSLLRSELLRLVSRPLLRVAVLATVAGIAIGGLVAFATTDYILESEYQAEVAADAQTCLTEGVEPPQGGPRLTDPEFCNAWAVAGVDDPRLHLEQAHGHLAAAIAPLVVIGWLIGATSVGADWQGRAMTTLLTFEPRRLRVFAVKLLVASVVVFVLTVLALVIWLGALMPSLVAHGAEETITSAWWTEQAWTVLRGGGLVVGSVIMAIALAFLGRSTAFALGVGFAYVVVAENVLASGLPGWRRWLVIGNAIVFANGRDTPEISDRTVLEAGLLLTVIPIVLMIGAYIAFRRQEVA